MDIRTEDLDAAVEAGVIDANARDRLIAFARTRLQGASPDNESFRLLTGFNDIFVALACLLMLGALPAMLPTLPAALLTAALSWGLAEYFTRKRRMALPSIILLLAFVGSIFVATFTAITMGGHWDLAMQQLMLHQQFAAVLAPTMVAGLAAAAAAALHWRRFRVPITLAAGAGALAIGAVALAGAVIPSTLAMRGAALLSGLAIFAVAMLYDMRDRERLTRNTDIAFWLHLLAAPLIVHSVFKFTGMLDAGASPAGAAVVLLLYAALTLVALVIDRRALLVSAMIYVLFALQSLFEAGRVAAGFGLTALILGSFLVMLSAGWASLRRRLLAHLPAGWSARLPVAGLSAHFGSSPAESAQA
ncbi:hypothetical protein FJQ54_09810 [Sandaracinobacter neustonicus]|uniref:DUF2157 domain-containing protein n=1 Tax=Sandaracinobacter neustonicus TaxID=1715348 RepID=A0A501XLX1_9SPHN|nr:hypothetical protein [Sandaracinobacter neustonicus]TPE61177.1 hypothetical protein FJQ54_09810 [Sandaracinobacter neustonicus]